MVSLVLEGGSFRGIFTAGVLDAFLDHQIDFRYVIGVSAGISNASSYISKQRGRNMEIMHKYRNDSRYSGFYAMKNDHSPLGIQFIFETIPNELVPFDYETYLKFDGKVIAVATQCNNAEAAYLNALIDDPKNAVYKATCALPGITPSVNIHGIEYADGGVADSIPVQKAILDGCKKHVIVLTQPKGFKKKFDLKSKACAKRIENQYPELAKAMATRHIRYNEALRLCDELESEGKAIILRPSYSLSSMERDVHKLLDAYYDGYMQANRMAEQIKSFMKGSL